MTRLVTEGWPEFMLHDRVTGQALGRVVELFGDLELVLVAGDEPLAAGWAVPLPWSGEVGDLPAGYHESLSRAIGAHDAGQPPDTLAILAAGVRSDRRGAGLGTRLLSAFRDRAARAGWPRVICPVRPTLKARYPLTPIERYAAWTRPDGAPFDPWLRTHWRMGARVLAPAPRSQTLTATVAEWESWTGMAFPDSGEYVIPGGLSVLHVDRDADEGRYVEPNVWVRHA